MGRSLSSREPPATASAMRMRSRASVSSFTETTMACFSEARMQASNSCSTRVSTGQSCARTSGRGRRDVVESLHDARRGGHVGLGRRAHAAVVLAHEGRAAVAGDVGVLAVERQVVVGRAAAEREGVGQGGSGRVRRARAAAWRRSSRSRPRRPPRRARRGRVSSSTRSRPSAEDVERGLVDAADLVRPR